MTRREKFGVAWIGLIANVSLVITANDHHHAIAGAIFAGLTCCVIGWWIL